MYAKKKRSAGRGTTASPPENEGSQLNKTFLAFCRLTSMEQQILKEVSSYMKGLRVALVLVHLPRDIWSMTNDYLTLIDKFRFWTEVASTKSLIENTPKGFTTIQEEITADIRRNRKELAEFFGPSIRRRVWKGIPVEQTSYNPVKANDATRLTMSTSNAQGVAWQSECHKISFLNHRMLKNFDNGPKYVQALALSARYLAGLEQEPSNDFIPTYDWSLHVWDIENAEHYIANVAIQPRHLGGLDAKGETILLHIDEPNIGILGNYLTTSYVYTHNVLSRKTEHFTQKRNPDRDTRFLLDHDGSSILCFQRFERLFTFVRYNFGGEQQGDVEEIAWDDSKSVLDLKMEVIDRKIIVFDELQRLETGIGCTLWRLRQLEFDSQKSSFHIEDRFVNSLRKWGFGANSGFSNLLSPRKEGGGKPDPFYILSRWPEEVEGGKSRTILNLIYPALHPFSVQIGGECCECWRIESQKLQSINSDHLDEVKISGNKTHVWMFHRNGIEIFAKEDLSEETRLKIKTDSRLLRWPSSCVCT